MTLPHAHLDTSTSPPQVIVPREYNAAVDLVDRHVAEGRGERVAVIDDAGPYTYRELAARVSRAGNALRALGVHPEQRVAMVMADTVDFVAVFLGAIKLGAVPVPLNTLLTTADYEHLVADCRARVVIASDAFVDKVAPAARASRSAPKLVVARSPLGGAASAGEPPSDFDALLAAASPELDAAPTTSDDVAFWLYSSGSTGKPKGAVHLHAHLPVTAGLYARGVLGLRDDDVVFSAAKLFFAYGLGNALTFPLSLGATSVLSAARPTPAHVMSVFRARQPTIFGGVPTLFASILADEENGRATGSARLRVCISAGEALPRHVGERWRERFGVDILDGIGSTEMLHVFLSNRPGAVRYGTTGEPVPGYEVKLVGDDGGPVADGEVGSLWVRGPSSAIHYWNDRSRSLATFHGPWTRTGDSYSRDADGFYTYAGRGDDMLKVGGIWVSPFEVESALADHDAVLEAAVIGARDAEGLVKPKAFVVLKDPTRASEELVAELKAFVKDRLAPFKYPRWIELVAELPKTATGKIQRFKLRG